MPIWKLQTSIWSDTVLARDAMVITPHFNDHGVGSDPQSLCDDLAVAIAGWCNPANQHQVEVKAYDAQGTKPVYPQAVALEAQGGAPVSPVPREIALCLSFYADRNVKRHRGRVYVPAGLFLTNCDVRPIGTQRDKVAALAPIFSDLGGLNVDWVVYSRLDNQARTVTHWWVDDEWDTVRSRGLRSTTRTVGTTSG